MKNSLLILILYVIAGGTLQAQTRGDFYQDVPVWTDLTEAMKTPKAIRRLDLSKTKLREIPADVFELYNLEELVLAKNQLKAIPPDIKRLKNLRVLDLSRNKLESLPPEIGQLKNLEKLELGHNDLYVLPVEIGDCQSLEYLSIWENNITSLPATLKKITVLKEIDLRNIVISDPSQQMMQEMLPGVKIHFMSNCHCGPN